jgi:hypothetical protein
VNGKPVQAIARSSLSEIPTFEVLFLRINAFTVQVSYDEATGRPSDIYIDYDNRIVGHEWIVNATYPVEIDALDNVVVTDPPITMAPTAAAMDDPASVRGSG